MRVLLFHQYFLEADDPGGGRWNEMARLWKEAGHEVTVVAGMMHAHKQRKRPEYRGKRHCRVDQDGIVVHRTHVSETYNRGFAGRFWGYCSYMLSSCWVGLFKLNDTFDVVVVTSPPLFACIPAWLVATVKRLPLVFEVRDLWPESAIDLGVIRQPLLIRLAFQFETFFYRKATLVVTLTPGQHRVLLVDKKVPAHKLAMLPNAADFGLVAGSLKVFERNVFRKTHGFDGFFVVVYVGAHGVANNLKQLIGAARQVQSSNIVFVLIGDGMEKKRLQQEARSSGVRNVRFFDAVPKNEVFRYISAADIGISILKKCDTFRTVYSNKTFDYLSCRKPVIMAIDGVSRELIEQAGAGTFVDPESTEELVRTVLAYRNDPARVEREGQLGYEFVRRHFDRELLARQYLYEIKSRIENPA